MTYYRLYVIGARRRAAHRRQDPGPAAGHQRRGRRGAQALYSNDNIDNNDNDNDNNDDNNNNKHSNSNSNSNHNNDNSIVFQYSIV